MRYFKLIVFSFLFFGLIITGISLLVPSRFHLSRAINIAETDAVQTMRFVRDTAQWRQWHPAFMDTAFQKTLAARQIRVQPLFAGDTLVRMAWHEGRKRPVQNTWTLHRFAASDSATLQWAMDFHLRFYPWERLQGVFFEKTYGPMMEQGLQQLKATAEQ